MCTRATCKICGKATFVGCGRHVESVLAGVAPSQRCQGHAPAAAAPDAPRAERGPLSRVLGALRPGRDRRGP